MRLTHALLVFATLALPSACDQAPESSPPAPSARTEAPGKSTRWTAVEDLVRSKDYAAAYAALEAMQVPDQADPELILRLAEVRRLQGDQVKAILLLREALAADPSATQLVLPLASLYLQVGEIPLARDTLESGRKQGLSSPEMALLLGQTYGRLDDLDQALREFDNALSLGAKAHVVLYNKGLVLGQQKKHAQAIAALEEVVRASPDWPAGRRELGRAILDSLPQDKAEVNRALDLLIGVQPQLVDDWRLQESIGDAWLLLGDFDAAVLAYTEALRLGQNPKSVEDRYRVAVTKQRERDSAAVPPPKRP